jgi:hypothetical protein
MQSSLPGHSELPTEMRSAALRWLAEPCARTKAQGVQALMESWKQGEVGLNPLVELATSASIPGRPERP